jgi:hypothetical protein
LAGGLVRHHPSTDQKAVILKERNHRANSRTRRLRRNTWRSPWNSVFLPFDRLAQLIQLDVRNLVNAHLQVELRHLQQKRGLLQSKPADVPYVRVEGGDNIAKPCSGARFHASLSFGGAFAMWLKSKFRSENVAAKFDDLRHDLMNIVRAGFVKAMAGRGIGEKRESMATAERVDCRCEASSLAGKPGKYEVAAAELHDFAKRRGRIAGLAPLDIMWEPQGSKPSIHRENRVAALNSAD